MYVTTESIKTTKVVKEEAEHMTDSELFLSIKIVWLDSKYIHENSLKIIDDRRNKKQ